MLQNQNLWLLAILVVGLAAGSRPTAAAAGLIMLLNLTGFQSLFRYLSRWGETVGLILLIAVVLLPLAQGAPSSLRLGHWSSWAAILLSIASGAIASHLGGRGLQLLRVNPELLPPIMLGSLLGVALWRGVPLSPLTAGGFLCVVFGVWSMLK